MHAFYANSTLKLDRKEGHTYLVVLVLVLASYTGLTIHLSLAYLNKSVVVTPSADGRCLSSKWYPDDPAVVFHVPCMPSESCRRSMFYQLNNKTELTFLMPCFVVDQDGESVKLVMYDIRITLTLVDRPVFCNDRLRHFVYSTLQTSRKANLCRRV